MSAAVRGVTNLRMRQPHPFSNPLVAGDFYRKAVPCNIWSNT
ncbi:hypothetical protein IMCC9480_2435 [Oxalobacteraceae bacterium IMCC9480]|nr:hypothetical protein IMCC9480_2435 [Oxalobacteraceae bacterium IMCC9480]